MFAKGVVLGSSPRGRDDKWLNVKFKGCGRLTYQGGYSSWKDEAACAKPLRPEGPRRVERLHRQESDPWQPMWVGVLLAVMGTGSRSPTCSGQLRAGASEPREGTQARLPRLSLAMRPGPHCPQGAPKSHLLEAEPQPCCPIALAAALKHLAAQEKMVRWTQCLEAPS